VKLKQKIYGAALFFAPMSLMAGDGTSVLKTALSAIVGLAVIVSFCVCLVYSVMGAVHINNGGNFERDFITVIFSAGAFAICGAIFYAFGLGEAVLTPTF
jgi:hypothetical protein